MTITEAVIKVENLYKYYNGIKAVDGISFEVFENEIFGIVGPNGAGKTTLVECIEGLRIPDKGTIKVLDLDPLKDSKKLKDEVGIQLQEGKLPDRIKVREALDLFASFYSRSVPWQPILEDLGLLDKVNSYFDTLSGGQKQRLFIALSLSNDPKIIFFDELTTGLDPQARRTMWGLIKKIRDKGKTIVLVTHYMEEAEQLCDRVAIIDKGKIIALDTPANLIKSLGKEIYIRFSVDDPSIINKLEKIKGINKIEQNKEQIIVHCQENETINQVTKFLTENNIRFYDFSIGGPTLEDVFLSLTGRRIRD